MCTARYSCVRLRLFLLSLALVSCNGSPHQGGDGASPAARLAALRPCPTAGPGAVEGDLCFVLTPAETGLPATGRGADVDQYALRSVRGRRGQLLVFLNGSNGDPGAGSGSMAGSWYGVARDAGLHVLAVSYASQDSIGQICGQDQDCLEPTRLSILTGRPQPGAAREVRDLTLDEGVHARMAAALVTLDDRDPAGGWSAFLRRSRLPDAAAAITWSRVLVSGYSQGGGHAALLGKVHALNRVLMLAAPCDVEGHQPARWLVNDGSYATDPALRYVGLGGPDDPICPGYPLTWQALQMAPEARHDDAIVCPGETGHSATVMCGENAPVWRQMLE